MQNCPIQQFCQFHGSRKALMSESRFYHITKEGKIVPVATMAEALAETRDGGFVWLDYTKPTKEELSLLIDPFGLHPLSIEDCLDENLIPKIDDYPRYTFLLFNAFNYAQGVLSIDEVDMFLGTDFLITVNIIGAENRQLLKSIERTVEINHKNILQGPAFLLHIIMDYIVDQKYVAIEAFETVLDKAEETILSDLSDFNPADLLNLRRDLFAIRRSLFHEREILIKIYRKDCPFIPEKALFYYRDIYDHLTKFFELTETSRDIVTSLMEMYLSMLNNRMSETANKTNMTVRRLTFITTIFMPLTLLAGIGGMSEWSMMTGPQNWKIAYPLFMLAMIIIGIVSYHLLKRLDKKDPDKDKT
jgi:magnesium transporter